MSKFRKKPVVIEATQWVKNGDHPEDGIGAATDMTEGLVVRYFRHPFVKAETLCNVCGVRMHDHGWIDTLEAGHRVCPGDWIITGVLGERYPCKPDIFAAIYDETELRP